MASKLFSNNRHVYKQASGAALLGCNKNVEFCHIHNNDNNTIVTFQEQT